MYAFLIAGTLFVAAISTVLVLGRDMGGDPDSLDGAEGQLRSESLAEFLVGSPGVGWENGADGIERLGFREADGTGLDEDHLDLLRGARLSLNVSNGLVDYEEAVASLGFDETAGFHVRISPVGLQEVLGEADLSHLATAYVGDWDSFGGYEVPYQSDDDALVRAAQAEINTTAAPLTVSERNAIIDLGVGFDDRVAIFDAGPDVAVDFVALPDEALLDVIDDDSVPGGVYPDNKQYLSNVFAPRLPDYDVLVVGSGVDQSSLTADSVKSAVKDFVLAGGNLIVFGSDDANFQWLQPLFDVGTSNVNGGAYADDPSHPVLWQPQPLSWSDYDNHGLGWDIKDQGSGDSYDDFQHVIQEDGEDLLAISNDGAFGDGRIFLTTYRPGEIVQLQGVAEALGFLRNMILLHDYSHLYLEYGDQVPQGASVQVAIRQSHLDDPQVGQVPVRVEVLTWDA